MPVVEGKRGNPMAKFQVQLPALILLVISLGRTALAEAPLKGLPSKPGPHIEKIKSLADNTWLELGVPEKDATWGRARGRSWCAALPFAPEVGGAFLLGEGIHGYANPDGHYMDDLWFYDVNA